jgi:acyl-[acyl-carrier-protein]-phospholipid O-acyltransferase/long-chain-fatty-acid--[acyl-carrier-protein] ligase
MWESRRKGTGRAWVLFAAFPPKPAVREEAASDEEPTVIALLLRFVLRLMFRIRVRGALEGLQGTSRLVVANHLSAADALLLGLFLPGRFTVVLPVREARTRWMALALRAVPHVRLDLSNPRNVRPLARRLAAGESLLVFPENRVSLSGRLMKVYESPAILAARLDAAVVPVHLAGAEWSPFGHVRGAVRRRWRVPVTITVLEATRIPYRPALRARARRMRAGADLLRVLQCAHVEATPRLNLYEALCRAAARSGNATRILEDASQVEFTYRTLRFRALAMGRLLSRRTASGAIVGVLMPNVATTVSLLFGMAASRRVPAMLNYTAGPGAVRHACRVAAIGTVLTSRAFVEAARLGDVVAALDSLEVLYLEDLRGELTVADKLWLFAAGWWRHAPFGPLALPQDPAVVLFTSGSEGRPKGVAISHAALTANMAQMQAAIDFGPADKFLNALPMFHSFGLTACTLMPLLTGTRLFLYTSPLHYRVIPEIAASRDCTYVFGTSTFLGQYARQARGYDFRSVRVVVSGGEKLNEEVARLWSEQFGVRIMEGYGTTECGPAISLNAPQRYRRGTVGNLLPGVEHRIEPVAGIADGGVLHVRSPNLMLGYLLADRPGVIQFPSDGTADGWYATGDVVSIDEDGFVTIRGRVRRFAKVAGEMVSLELVERIASAASPGHQHAATIETTVERGETIVLFTTDVTLDRMRLVRAAGEVGAPEIAVPRRITLVEALPLLGSGKIDYAALGRLLAQTTPGGSAATPAAPATARG